MSGAVVGGAVASFAVSQVGNAIIGGGSGSGGASTGGGGSSGGLTVQQQQYAYNGPAPGRAPTIGGSEKQNSFKEMTAPKADTGRAATTYNLRSTPTQAVGQEQANADYKDMWADRLSKYLDYNTRSLG